MALVSKIKAAIVEQVYCLFLLVVKGYPFVKDIVLIHLRRVLVLVGLLSASRGEKDTLPDSVESLLDPVLLSRLTGRPVQTVEYSDRLEQHANSTDRAWFKVCYEKESTPTYVFAKVQAKTVWVRAMMCIFDVYRNELDAYKNISFPKDLKTPLVHCAKWSPSRFVLILEDLRQKKAIFPNIWEKDIDKNMAKRVLRTLAKFHAAFWGNKVPKGAWKDGNRPYKGKVIGLYTLYKVEKLLPDLLPKGVSDSFRQALWRWDDIEAFYRRSYPRTMCHSDTHFGNFYILPDGDIGTFDFQCKAEEHPMRDVTYFLSCSYPEQLLAQDEEELIRYYLSQLNEFGVPRAQVPSFEECWLQYRMQLFYSLYAFIFSGGFSDLMDTHQTLYGVRRIVKVYERVDSIGALYDMFDGKI